MGLVSPNDLLKAARHHMLDGSEPTSHEDWTKVFNFLAFNIDKIAQPEALLVFRVIYDVPLTEDEIRKISAFQTKDK